MRKNISLQIHDMKNRISVDLVNVTVVIAKKEDVKNEEVIIKNSVEMNVINHDCCNNVNFNTIVIN